MKCKNINDEIKIFVQGYSGSPPVMKAYLNDSFYNNVPVVSEGGSVSSGSFTLNSIGHWLFKINLDGQGFLISFRVGVTSLKNYYLDAGLESGKTLPWELFFLNGNSVSSGVLNDIEDGLYSTDPQTLSTGAYRMEIPDAWEDFIIDFVECDEIDNSENSDDIYWIFPNNL